MDISPQVAATSQAGASLQAATPLSVTHHASLQPGALDTLQVSERVLLAQTGSVSPDQILGTTPNTANGATGIELNTSPIPVVDMKSVTFEPLIPHENPVTLQLPVKEADIYQHAGLRVVNVGDRPCLVRESIDWTFKDAMGQTNKDRAAMGLSPIDPNTKLPLELHHVGQDPNGPLAELTVTEHRMPPNNLSLHPVRENSTVDHGVIWTTQRESHWFSRALAA